MAHNLHFPLAEIIETKTYPHARTERTSLSQKFWDTYYVIAGKSSLSTDKPHVGLFDYLTSYIPVGLLFLLNWCLDNAIKNFWATVLLVPVVLINIPLLIARVVFSAAVTILFSPLIAIVHGISRLISNQNHKEMLSLVGELQNGNKQSLKDYLDQNELDIEELNIKLKSSTQASFDEEGNTPGETRSNSYQLMFWKKAVGASASLMCEGCLNGGCNNNHAPFSVKITDKEPNKQTSKIHALFKLNVGGVVTNIEKTKMDSSEKQNILSL